MWSDERKVQMNNVELLEELRELVGNEQFKKIIEHFKGQKIYFANYSGYISKEERDDAIWKDFIHDMSVNDIAEKYGLKVSTVYKITENRCKKVAT